MREIIESDLVEHARLFSKPGFVHFLCDEKMTPEELRVHVACRMSHRAPAEGVWCNLAVSHEGAVAGEVSLGLVGEVHRCCDVVYVFVTSFHGREFATEATRAMTDVAIRTFWVHRVIARLDAENGSSRRAWNDSTYAAQYTS